MHGRSLSSDLPAGGENKLNSGRRANVVPKLNVRSTINYKWAWLKLAAPWQILARNTTWGIACVSRARKNAAVLPSTALTQFRLCRSLPKWLANKLKWPSRSSLNLQTENTGT
jgi:hypothetical protein